MSWTPRERLDEVESRIEKAALRVGRSRSEITLLAVTKTVSFERVAPFLEAGIVHVGENRVQEALEKYGGAQGEKKLPAQVRLHGIGALQTNKAKKACQLFDVVQTLDREALGEDLNRHAQAIGKVLPCLIEIKVSSEPSKAGLDPAALPEFLAKCAQWPYLNISGLMGIPPQGDDADSARPYFAQLRKLFEISKLSILSMGMSNDFEVAIEEGATMIRLGTILFGERFKGMANIKRLVLIGGGNMGEAIVAGLLRSGNWKPSQITVTDVRPEQLARLKKTYKIVVSDDNRWATRESDILLLAIKPQQIKHVLEDLGPVIQKKQLVISIAAGIPTAFIERFLAKGIPVVRVMPNTPALVSAGAAAIGAGKWANESHEKLTESIFSTVGTVVRVAEKDIDAVTALSGSGPAYLFYLAEAMQEAGRAMGLALQVSDALVRQTLYGAGLLLKQSHEEPHTLRQRVTSPGGTTEAAVKVLEKALVKNTFAKAMKKAKLRAQELSKTY